MSSNNTSGQGSRPTTSGGVDNIGAADAFTPHTPSRPGDTAPGPAEKMAEKKKDSASVKEDDSAPFGLTGAKPEVADNTEAPEQLPRR